MASELEKDIAELESLRQSATRGNVQTFLDNTLTQWRLKLDSMRASERRAITTENATSINITTSGNSARPMKILSTYAYDESDKYVKIYYSIAGCTPALSPERITTEFGADSFHIIYTDVDMIDYEMTVKGLLHPVDPEKCVTKPKTDSLLVMLKKRKEGQTWGSLLKLDKSKQAKVPNFDDNNTDPQDSLMKMMKQMYDEGDDDMKRTMRKAWHEGQEKKSSGGLGMGDL